MQSLDDMRKEFWRLTAQKEELEKVRAPVMAEMAALRAQICALQEKLAPLKAERRRIEGEGGLVELDQLLAFYAKGLGRKVGPRPGSES